MAENKNELSEKEWEDFLENGLSGLPPEEIAAAVTPWKSAMRRVLAGFALGMITLNFWCLQYLLPAAGLLLQFLGFRMLRRENIWFRRCLVLTVLRMTYVFPLLIINSTIQQQAFWESNAGAVLTAVNLIANFLELFCFWQGMRSVQKKAGFPPRAASAGALIFWFAGMCLLAMMQYQGLLVGSAMIIGYFLILRSIRKLSLTLDEAGYSIQPSSVRVRDSIVVLAVVGVLLFGLGAGYAFGGKYPMKWEAAESAVSEDTERIRAHLQELGFPQQVLKDLCEEDIAACQDAVRVVVDVALEPVSNGKAVTVREKTNSGERYQTERVYDRRELQITGVAVQLSGERERWMIFHHFLFVENPGFPGTEAIQLWPVSDGISEGWSMDGEVTGRLLCQQNGITVTAPYDFLGRRSYLSSIPFSGEERSGIFAAFSMPQDGECCRGYLAYPIREMQDGFIISSWFNYTHQTGWLQYPAISAMEHQIQNGLGKSRGFVTVQDALQFYPEEKESGIN